MDKETLSNYGWIVICVLVLAVMIALATPFGGYISTAVKSTTQGLFDTNKNALNSTGLINVGDQSFSDGTGDSGGGNQTTEVKREAGSIIPDGAKYTVKATNTVLEGNGTNKFPDTPSKGDIYEEGDYAYTHNRGDKYGTEWSVAVKDTTKTSYGEILSEIAGKPITNMYYTFYGCTSLTTAPAIPSSVTNMSNTFNRCVSLATAPIIPDGVTNMYWTFFNCESLITAPVIPNSVTNMDGTFVGCSSLKSYVGSTSADGDFSNYTLPSSLTNISGIFSNCTSLIMAPNIPDGITDMSSAFNRCTSLTTAPTIPSSVTNMDSTFECCSSLKTYVGSTGSDGDFSNYTIPNGITNMSSTFSSCPLIVIAPVIPTSVTNMFGTFTACYALTKAPTIPRNVTDMKYTFASCKSLTGTIEINANPTRYDKCLLNTKITKVTGSTTLKAKILATK